MTELDQLREQCRNQELTILNQNVDIARLRKQVSDLVNKNNAAQRHIGRLQTQIGRAPRDRAETVFRRIGE